MTKSRGRCRNKDDEVMTKTTTTKKRVHLIDTKSAKSFYFYFKKCTFNVSPKPNGVM